MQPHIKGPKEHAFGYTPVTEMNGKNAEMLMDSASCGSKRAKAIPTAVPWKRRSCWSAAK